ncbi:hypothetical protein PIB30_004150 [Stylosanthes scabra]|uniref:Uncharacterized protein n=1 Tax=Stylosanthes scabra TaxID=79078 RepID=A0ABU6Q4E0_9FABA|nr:hypothetical protein [Stylosanthes scabra]
MMTPTRSRLLSPLQRVAGRSPKTQDNVNEEYLKAFRTKSYVDICKKVQGQLRKIRSSRGLSSSSSSSSTSSPLPFYMHLTEYLLEPRQEVIEKVAEKSKVHHLVLEYFEASLEACQCCDTILQGIHETRIAYAKVTKIIKLSNKSVLDGIDEDDQTHKAICGDLASFALQKNPLSIISPMMFREIHDKYIVLLQRLKSKRGKIRRMLTIKRVCKKVGGIGIIASFSALIVALVVFAFHSVVGIMAAGIMAAPCIVGGSFGLMRKRLHDEVEHRREIANICLKSGNGKCEILKQVVREFHDYESNFLDQLEELEEHIYLCFLTINRSRGLVMQEIVKEEQEEVSMPSHTPLKEESLTGGLALHPFH